MDIKGYFVIYTYINGERKEYPYEAHNVIEALGMFFMENPELCYNDVVEHLEI